PASRRPGAFRRACHRFVTGPGDTCRTDSLSGALRSMTRFLAGLLPLLCLASPARAGAIYPIDRASVLAGSRFDLKVEFDQVVPQDQIKVTVGGKPAEAVFGRRAQFLEREDGKAVSSYVLQNVSVDHPGPVDVVATGGGQTLKVRWDVYG